MHIREPRDFEGVRSQRQTRLRLKKWRKVSYICIVVLIALLMTGYGLYARPYPAVAAHTIIPTTTGADVAIQWPTSGQGAVGAEGQGVMAATSSQAPVPTASVAKVMTALAILKKYPITAGQSGPTITMTASDVALYQSYLSRGGSVVRVEVGEQLTEYQALQAMLLPSANNIADSTAIWAYGSMAQYLVAANQLGQSFGMSQSTFAGDASGFTPSTTSTAHDLVLLGQKAMLNGTIREIVSQKSTTLPLVGVVTNVNVLLGQSGIIGIKTGNSDEAGGCYLFAATRKLSESQTITTIGAVTAAPDLEQAMRSSLPVLDSFYAGYKTTVVVPKGTVVARYVAPWDKTIANAVTAQDTSIFNWGNSRLTTKVTVATLPAPQAIGTPVGNIEVNSARDSVTTPVVLGSPLSAPSWQWRVFRR
jgi:D-alanyl-D-alanine carboxypeptidase (penicillin-binding protein 5/6)